MYPKHSTLQTSLILSISHSEHPTSQISHKLSPVTQRSGSYNIFRKSLLNFIRPSASNVYNINDTIGIKLITRLRLGFSHLRERKFKHNFQHTLNPLCSCSAEVESTSHYVLRCYFFDAFRAKL